MIRRRGFYMAASEKRRKTLARLIRSRRAISAWQPLRTWHPLSRPHAEAGWHTAKCAAGTQADQPTRGQRVVGIRPILVIIKLLHQRDRQSANEGQAVELFSHLRTAKVRTQFRA